MTHFALSSRISGPHLSLVMINLATILKNESPLLILIWFNQGHALMFRHVCFSLPSQLCLQVLVFAENWLSQNANNNCPLSLSNDIAFLSRSDVAFRLKSNLHSSLRPAFWLVLVETIIYNRNVYEDGPIPTAHSTTQSLSPLSNLYLLN